VDCYQTISVETLAKEKIMSRMGRLIWISLSLLLLTISPVLSQEPQQTEIKKTWTGNLADGREITQADLYQILQAHALWGKSDGKEGQRVNLSQTCLAGANLEWTNLRRANLLRANLSDASLFDADLVGANLKEADLSRANLYLADLAGANLQGVDLTKANLIGVNLRRAIFEPKLGSLPNISSLFGVQGLSTLIYINSPHGLMELREAYKKAGMREQERQVTYALNHSRQEKLWREGGFLNKLQSLFYLTCFDWPCRYGMAPSKPLKILILELFCFSFLYMLALGSRHSGTGLWVVLPPVQGQGGKDRAHKLTNRSPFRPVSEKRLAQFNARLWRLLRVVRLGFCFSLVSAFSLGSQLFSVGNWITRLQKRGYTLRATGGVRMVTVLQSLLSVYLLALWALTYFSRPFG
jgi:hypothetical protein